MTTARTSREELSRDHTRRPRRPGRQPARAPSRPPLRVSREAPDRNLALELARVTEAAAMAAARWVGRGDKNGGDGAAVDAMRALIGTVSMRGVVVIGEGEKDQAPMLYNGEEVGDGTGPLCDVAVDPIDGTTLMAKGMANADRGDRGVRARHHVRPVGRVLHGEDRRRRRVGRRHRHHRAGRREHPPRRQGQARPARGRHRLHPRPAATRGRWSREVRDTGARIKFITDGDVAGAISAARPDTGVDLLVGIGGTPEGIIAAAALKCMGGVIQARLWPRDDEEREKAIGAGHDLDRVLTTTDLVSGNDIFFCATGITTGDLLRGVRYYAETVRTQSIVMRSKSGTIRILDSLHQLGKLRAYSAVDFDRF